MPVGPLDLLTIQVRDWPAAVAWYRDVLGLVVMYAEEDDQFCMFATTSGGAAVALASDHAAQAVKRDENRLAPGFRVDDLDTVLAELVSRGAKVDSVIDGADEGYRLARVWDPEGNRLHLYTYG